MFRMLGVIEHTALYGQNPDIRYAYVCAVYIRNRINTDGPALRISDVSAKIESLIMAHLCYLGFVLVD